jgi:diguanylate cyclase (GGDEF)-like protein
MEATSCHRGWKFAAARARTLARIASIVVVALSILLASGEVDAQQFVFRHYQEKEGLGNLSVTCLLQDHEGFIWACSENGLYRYDGVAFERVGDLRGLDRSAIRAAAEDSTGKLWIGTAQDLYRSEGLDFKPVRPAGRHLKLTAESRIAALSLDHVLVIDGDELLELNAASGAWQSRAFFTQSLLEAIPALGHLSGVHVDRLQRIWLGCGRAICRVEHGAVTLLDTTAGVPDDTWTSWTLDRDGDLWARGQAHVVVLRAGAGRFEIRDPPHARLTTETLNVPLVQDPQGRILTSTDLGLSRWQEGWHEYSGINGIPTTGIAAILSSRDGQVWLGVPGLGVARWAGYDHFESWTKAQGLAASPVWSIAPAADHSVLLGTRAGCSRLDTATSVAAPCPFGDLPRGEIRVMAEARGTLWFGMSTGELFRIASGDLNATLIATVPAMRKLYVDASDQLWIGTTKGIAVVAPESMHVDAMQLPVQTGEVADITQDNAGAIWLATQGGVFRGSGGRWTRLHVEGEHAAAGFTTIAAGGGNWFWAGAASHGMLHLHVAGDGIDEMHWVEDLMLARAIVNFTTIDRRGWVWAGTDTGVVVFDGRVWRRFKTPDGLIWNNTLPNSFLADGDGSVWIGTAAGLTHIRQPEALLQTTPIDLRITHFALGGKALDAQSQSLPWEPNLFLTAHTSQLNYGKGSQSTILKVRLRGLSDDWFEIPGHDVYLPALGPGGYKFEAVAIDADHGQMSAAAEFSFEILPPWWRTLWFQLAAASAALVLLVLAGTWRLRKRRAARREQERQTEEHEALLVRATRDALTGLWNRPAILENLAREIASCRELGTSLAIAIIDIDHFKSINDTRGHLAGDEVLRTLGEKLKSRLRNTDALGRYGGEEFLLVMPGAARQRPFMPLERLQRAIAEIPFAHAGSPIRVTASFGVAWLTGTDTAESLLSRADKALYGAKQAGRNRVEYAATG